jgi:hypothetical protein
MRDWRGLALRDLRTANRLFFVALRTHFRLFLAQSTIGVGRQVTIADAETVRARYNELLSLFASSANRFETGVPVNGIFTAAEAPLGGPVRFGPAFTNVNSHFGDRIGPNSRAAILIHEGVHVFDRLSCDDNRTHISEFDEPRYSLQSADDSQHNPSLPVSRRTFTTTATRCLASAWAPARGGCSACRSTIYGMAKNSIVLRPPIKIGCGRVVSQTTGG